MVEITQHLFDQAEPIGRTENWEIAEEAVRTFLGKIGLVHFNFKMDNLPDGLTKATFETNDQSEIGYVGTITLEEKDMGYLSSEEIIDKLNDLRLEHIICHG